MNDRDTYDWQKLYWELREASRIHSSHSHERAVRYIQVNGENSRRLMGLSGELHGIATKLEEAYVSI